MLSSSYLLPLLLLRSFILAPHHTQCGVSTPQPNQQLAAADAAVHGWPLTTLQPLLHSLASSYSQQLMSLLSRPLVVALQQQRQQVASAMLDVLAEEAEWEQADLLADALLLLAYQVGVCMLYVGVSVCVALVASSRGGACGLAAVVQ